MNNKGFIPVVLFFIVLSAATLAWVSSEYRMCKQAEKNQGVKCEWGLRVK